MPLEIIQVLDLEYSGTVGYQQPRWKHRSGFVYPAGTFPQFVYRQIDPTLWQEIAGEKKARYDSLNTGS
jgi:hypothetical protein